MAEKKGTEKSKKIMREQVKYKNVHLKPIILIVTLKVNKLNTSIKKYRLLERIKIKKTRLNARKYILNLKQLIKGKGMEKEKPSKFPMPIKRILFFYTQLPIFASIQTSF